MLVKTTKKQNQTLCKKYPFLIPRNAWSGKKITDGKGYWPQSPDEEPKYNYEFTALDEMPDGWRIAFGEKMCEELRIALEKTGHLNDYYPVQIKEKFGQLRFYTNFSTKETEAIIDKYTAISEKTCIKCGKPATQITQGWISPFCDKCVPKYNGQKHRTIPIEKWFKKN